MLMQQERPLCSWIGPLSEESPNIFVFPVYGSDSKGLYRGMHSYVRFRVQGFEKSGGSLLGKMNSVWYFAKSIIR